MSARPNPYSLIPGPCSLRRLQRLVLFLLLDDRAVGLRGRRWWRVADALGILAHYLGSLFSRGGLLAALLRPGLFVGGLLQIRAHQKHTRFQCLLQQIRTSALGT